MTDNHIILHGDIVVENRLQDVFYKTVIYQEPDFKVPLHRITFQMHENGENEAKILPLDPIQDASWILFFQKHRKSVVKFQRDPDSPLFYNFIEAKPFDA